MCAATLMSWACQLSCHSWVISIATSLGILISSIYINSSFIIQTSYFNAENYSWLIWLGIDHFSINIETEEQAKQQIRETAIEYILTITVYIT